MIAKPERIFTRPRLRNILCSLFFVAVCIAIVGAIGSSRAIAERARASAFSEGGSWGQVDISSDADVTPPVSPQCSPPCLMPVVLTENFDNLTPPALPLDWLATNAQGSPPLWVTSDSGAPIPPFDTSPNAAFIDDPAVVSDKRLDSLAFPLAAIGAQLTFQQNFNLEASDVEPSLGFDGGVLEVSFDGGNTFQDILDAGGSFVVGGYNRIISTDRGSPIAGRQAWSGNSDGFITTVVNLPYVPGGGRLRWRMASDNSGSNEGWRVDTVYIAWCAPVPCQTPSPQPRPTPHPRPPFPSATPTVHGTPKITPLPRPTPRR